MPIAFPATYWSSAASTGFDPSQLSGLMLWLKSSAGVTTTSGVVTGWADQSGRGKDATAGTGYGPSVGYGLGGSYPSISFNGSTYMTGSQIWDGVQTYPDREIIVFSRITDNTMPGPRGGTVERWAFADAHYNNGDFSVGRYSGSPLIRAQNHTQLYTGSYPYNYFLASSSQVNNSNITFTTATGLNYVATNSGGTFPVAPTGNYMVGKSPVYGNPWLGEIYEIMEFSRNLTTTERNQVFSYLQSTYNYDPHFSSVSILLHMDGTNGSTTLTDSSPNALAVTANGGAQISTAQSKFGGASAYFNGSSYATTANSSLFNLTGDFTVEGWFYGVGLSTTTGTIIGKWQNPVAWTLTVGTTSIQFGTGNSGSFINTFTFSTTISNGQWYHIAITRSGSSLYCFLNGSQVGTTQTTTSNLSATSTMDIGYLKSSNSNYFNGYIDDIRVTKGICRYTSNFTPPTSPFPNS